MKEFLGKVLGNSLGGILFVTFILLIAEARFSTYVIVYLATIAISSYAAHKSLVQEVKKVAKEQVEIAEKRFEGAKRDERLWKQTLLERNSGFKTLLSFISEYEARRDELLSDFLRRKSHPAYRAAELVKEQTALRRKAEFENKRTQALIEMYEQYAPFLIDIKDEIPNSEDERLLSDYSEEEKDDEVINYLSKEEYRKLPAGERNQLALDRFWHGRMSKWLLGKLYERYVGFLYEQKKYRVEYFGISERYEDMGRDLICHKGNETLIIQCKNWSQFKTIYEKHIFQLFGSVFEYKEKFPTRKVSAVFYATTGLSDMARKIATTLGITLFESFKFDKTYPCIKCNISNATNEKIYHLPFDQKYDDTKIDRKSEMYCSTVAEAEVAGFRRAFRWRGYSNEG